MARLNNKDLLIYKLKLFTGLLIINSAIMASDELTADQIRTKLDRVTEDLRADTRLRDAFRSHKNYGYEVSTLLERQELAVIRLYLEKSRLEKKLNELAS